MKVFGTLVSLAVGLSLLLAIVAGGYFLFRYSMEMFGTLEPRLAALTAVVSFVAILCCSITAGSLKAANQQGVITTVFNNKEALYKQLMMHWVNKIQSGQDSLGLDRENELAELDKLLALYGSPKVISAYLGLCRSAEEEKTDERELLLLLIKLVKEMRSDLGSASLIFKETDLAALLLRC
jgi:phage gp36-like protein